MSVRDEIFPAEGDVACVQTQWARGWVYAVVGFAAAARVLAERRAEMHASVDQIGLAVFYLQRHRIELVLKQTLADPGEETAAIVKSGHSLRRLWEMLGLIVQKSSADDWRTLQESAVLLGVVATVGEDPHRPLAWPAATRTAHRRDRVQKRDQLRDVWSSPA